MDTDIRMTHIAMGTMDMATDTLSTREASLWGSASEALEEGSAEVSVGGDPVAGKSFVLIVSARKADA
jgi:hypothetical protein